MAISLSDLGVPGIADLIQGMDETQVHDPALRLAVDAIETGFFRDDEGNEAPLGDVRNPIEQIALLSWLSRNCKSTLSIEVGFGIGITACAILGSRRVSENPGHHLVFDPYGLDLDTKGQIPQEYLQRTFGNAFQRQYVRSQFGIGQMASVPEPPNCDFIFVDGDHHFEGVVSDFFAADKILSVGGWMVFDDASFPPVETLMNYVRANRPDYLVSWNDIPNTAILKKVGGDEREWDRFVPFEVPQRHNWAAAKSR